MRVPASTYRLQITERFDLLEAARTLGYLHELGVDWVYLSPLLASESGSEHGYDVADHRAVDPSRGRASGLSAVASEADRLGMGVLVDIVPNHVGVAQPWENEWWWQVLTYGPDSPYASAFDIEWGSGAEGDGPSGRVRIPVVAEEDLIEPVAEGAPPRIAHLSVSAGELHYRDQRFPLAPGTAENVDEDPNLVHARQHYELISWRRADRDLNYRRFFAVSTLVAIRVEDPQWFARSHAEILRWFDEGLVDGLRIDHPDGLRDPGRYLDDLAELTKGAYVLVEKILEPGEELPRSWATAGTTGYDALALIDRVLVDPAGQEPLDALETRLRGAPVDWPALVHDSKRAVADGILQSEVRRIARELIRVLVQDAPGEPADSAADSTTSTVDSTTDSSVDSTTDSSVDSATDSSVDSAAERGAVLEAVFGGVVDAVAELLACFPVYRSYLPEGREHLTAAVALARANRPDLGGVLDRIVPILADGAAAPAQRFQQTSGMVMAKGVEDRAFYRWSRLTSLNEVGGDPSVFSVPVEQFHTAMARRQADWPHAMTTATTHDTKRGADVRARISALAEVPDDWADALGRLTELAPMPDDGLASLLWQAVVGTWSARDAATDLRARLHGFAEKAMREAGERTGWIDPDVDFEADVHAGLDAAFDDQRVRQVVADLVARVAGAGWSNALAATLLTLTAPGVPDVYQGSELWQQSLVDPDNRRAVDFELRSTLLEALRAGERPPLSNDPDDDGSVKLLLTHVGLVARREHPELFTGYTPLTADGPAAEHVVAFDRGGAVAVATRLPIGLAARGGWGETRLRVPAGTWREQLTGRRVTVDERGVALAELLADYPVALLLREVARAGIGGAERGRFDVWAPSAGAVGLALSAVGQAVGDRLLPMARSSPGDDWDGWWVPTGPEPLGEVDYGYVLDPVADRTGAVLPDPRSRRQPSGVHAPSRTFEPGAFDWTDQAWTGRQLAGSVIYELHVGTFTPRGTLDSAIDRLDHLAQLGVNLVELMPVNAFDGPHGWGYDGVAWFAVHEPYGGPAAYQRFVDACHRAGIGVIQDVVYNHLGPSGNYLPEFGPYLASGGSNPWGAHVNLDGAGSEQVRAFILDNVRMWFEDYHVDGLRLDAVHALADRSDRHLLEDIARSAARSSAHLGRPCTVIAESELNDPHLITPREGGGYGLDGQWNDDFHHALHVALTGQTDGHYADFVSLSALAKACERGFVLDGTWSTFRERMHGKPIDTERLPGWRLVVCAQNHDQVGNRAAGDRLAESLDDDQLACAALLTLTTPFTPLLFQGEEWATTAPFPFFTSYSDPELGQAVTQGRLRDFAWMGWDPATVPDPQDPATFQRAKLDWAQLASGRHAVLLRVHRELIALRRRHPDLSDPDLTRTRCRVDEERRTFLMDRGPLLVAVNFSPEPVAVDLGGGHELLWATPAGARLDGDRAMLPGHAGALLARLVE